MDNSTILTILLAVIGSSGVWSVVLAIVQHRQRRKDQLAMEDSAERKMLLALAHDRIYYLAERMIGEYQDKEREGITKEEWENLDILYQGYKNLGGNGTCERLYKEIEKLPITQ